MGPNCDAVIVGAGAAGLRCALELKARRLKPIIFEASDHVGGRIRTDLVDGFHLDRGFQVLLTAYDECRSVLDYDSLRLGYFEPGAMVWTGSKFENVSDPWRRPGSLLKSACSPIGSLGDKLRIAKLRNRLVRTPVKRIYDAGEDASTIDYLRTAVDGFSVIPSSFYGEYSLSRKVEVESCSNLYSKCSLRATLLFPRVGWVPFPNKWHQGSLRTLCT